MTNDSDSTPATSLSLIERVKAKDAAAWGELQRLYAPLVVQWCRWARVRDDDIADIGQEVFLALARGIDRFEKSNGSHSFRGWLRSITQRKIVDSYRQGHKQPQADGGTDMQKFLAEVPDGATDDSAPQLAEETAILYRRAVEIISDDFPDWYLQAFWQLAVDNREPADVADALEVRVSAVYNVKARVLRRLREEFGGLIE